jgi:hypothetical protein
MRLRTGKCYGYSTHRTANNIQFGKPPADMIDFAKGEPNFLMEENSPYLLQHAYDPVNWYPWGAEAFEKARQENKPIK